MSIIYSIFISLQEEGILNSLFRTELLLEPQSLYFSPHLQDFEYGISVVIGSFQETVLSVENLVSDPYFDAFTRYLKLFLRFQMN